MGLLGDIVDAVEQALEDTGDWVEGAADDAADVAEDVWEWATDIVDDVSDWTVQAFEDAWDMVEEGAHTVEEMIAELEEAIESMPERAAEAYRDLVELLEAAAAEAEEVVEDVVEEVGNLLDEVGQVIDEAGDLLGDAVEVGFGVVEDAWNGTVGEIVDAFLEELEEAGIFDAVDMATLGLIDISYDGSDLHLDVGIEGVYHAGLDIGADGIYVEGSVWGAGSAAGGIGSDGSLAIGLEVGLEGVSSWGGEAGLDGDGNLSIEAHGEVHIPDPSAGTIDLEIEGEAEEHSDGFGVAGSTTVGHTSASGTSVGVGVHGSHEQHGDDSVTNVGVHATAGQVGVGEATVSLDHTIVHEDGETSTETSVTATTDTIFGHTEETVVLQESGDDGTPEVEAPEPDAARGRSPRWEMPDFDADINNYRTDLDSADLGAGDGTKEQSMSFQGGLNANIRGRRPSRDALDDDGKPDAAAGLVTETTIPAATAALGDAGTHESGHGAAPGEPAGFSYDKIEYERAEGAAPEVPDPIGGATGRRQHHPRRGDDLDLDDAADSFRPNPAGDGTTEQFFRPNPTGDGTTEQVHALADDVVAPRHAPAPLGPDAMLNRHEMDLGHAVEPAPVTPNAETVHLYGAVTADVPPPADAIVLRDAQVTSYAATEPALADDDPVLVSADEAATSALEIESVSLGAVDDGPDLLRDDG